MPYISAPYMTAVMPSVLNNNNFALHQQHQRDDGTQIWHQCGQVNKYLIFYKAINLKN